MVVAMFLGVFILAMPAAALLDALGPAPPRVEDQEAMLLSMAATMTLPMVAWMRFRGHAWRPCHEMSASMLVPTFVVMALLAAGTGSFGALMVIEHIAMLSGMLVVMIMRRDEYTGASHQHGARQREATT